MAKYPRTGTVYLVVKPGRYPYELSVVKATGQKPRSTPEGSIIVKLRLEIPHRAFEPVEPDVVVQVPEQHVDYPIVVESTEPDEVTA